MAYVSTDYVLRNRTTGTTGAVANSYCADGTKNYTSTTGSHTTGIIVYVSTNYILAQGLLVLMVQ